MEIISIQDQQIDIASILNQLEVINSLSPEKKKILLENVTLLQLDNQEILMRKGDEADCLYIVYSGRLAAFTDNDNWEKSIVGYIRHSEVIGELALISNLPRQSGVIALRKSFLLKIPNHIIKEFMLSEPQLTLKISALITERMNRMLVGKPTVNFGNLQIIAVFSAGQSTIDQAFIDTFLPEIKRLRDCIELDKNSFDKSMSEQLSFLKNELNQNLNRSRFLAKIENEHPLIILHCDESLSDWTLFCLNNADSFFYIAEENADRSLNVIEQYIEKKQNFFSQMDKKLVCIHPAPNIFIKNTSSWLNERKISSIHHLCLADAKTLQRFARILTNKSIALILSGGGLLGMAHIGVIRALRESGIEIDAIAGVSCGALISALYALYRDDTLVANKIDHLIKRRKKFRFLMWQIPIISLLKPYYSKKIFYELFQDFQIEDLWIPFCCVACNLSTTEDASFDRGSLADAVLASNSLPGILSPMLINGELFVDGGVINTMPVDVMKERLGGITIAVNVSQKREIEVDSHYQRFPSTWDIILNGINPFKRGSHVPLIHEIIGRTIIIGNKRKLAQVKAMTDYLIEPDFNPLGRINHQKIGQLIELGYQQALTAIKSWRNIPPVSSILADKHNEP